jgi:hypothetical protein
MKKSNKLLLAGFLLGLLFITVLHITLYAKYRNGHYTIYHEDDDLTSSSMVPFPNILFVSVRNLSSATVKFSETAQVEKTEDLQYVRNGDSLLITGKNGQLDNGFPVMLNLPYNITLSAFNSFLSFKAGKTMPENNPVIFLHRSTAIFSGINSQIQLGHVKVVASDSSTIAFRGGMRVNDLEVQLSNSSIEYKNGDPGQLSIITDSLSRIALQSKHLLKAKITTTTGQ